LDGRLGACCVRGGVQTRPLIISSDLQLPIGEGWERCTCCLHGQAADSRSPGGWLRLVRRMFLPSRRQCASTNGYHQPAADLGAGGSPTVGLRRRASLQHGCRTFACEDDAFSTHRINRGISFDSVFPLEGDGFNKSSDTRRDGATAISSSAAQQKIVFPD